MKKDATEFAHLIKAFKGAAEYMWTNFDHVMLGAIYCECIAIDDEIQKDTNQKENKVNISSAKTGMANFSFSNLEDIPATIEEQTKFDERLKILEKQQKERNLARINKGI